MTALGVIEEVHAKGWRIGREVSVVGFDDLFFTASLQPPLTTFRQPKHELGKQAMQLCLPFCAGKRPNEK
jgi:DNA-binding LacI/PurR family transcriptional regulator